MSARSTADDGDALAAGLLRHIRDVAVELRPHLAKTPVTLDTALDRDLGFDSLGRVELLVRIEKAFHVALPEAVFAGAETPRDLLRAIHGAGDGAAAEAAPDLPMDALGAAGALPMGAETLTAVLDWHAERHPARPHIRLHGDAGDGAVITFGDLKTEAEKVAAGLQEGGLEPGQSVVIMLPTGRDYFVSFFGALYAGGVPVPVYPPGRPAQIEEHLRRHAAIVANCLGAAMITVPEAQRFAQLLSQQVGSLRQVVTVEELMARTGTLNAPVLKAGDVAFVQYTSGSTGDPKGVVLTHANLLANVRAMGEATETDSEDVFVSWLPLYHDMGLIGAWLSNLHYANLVVVMAPLQFLSRPARWLRAIGEARGTMSAAPNFAYELCLNRIKDSDIEGLDLSSWRLALNGAEAINPDTMTRFMERFAPYGFREDAMLPVFGLAENTVGLTFPPLGRGPIVDWVGRDEFAATGHAREAEVGDPRARAFVNCGRPLPRHQVRIVDGAGRELPEREEGRLQFKGPSATSGYFRNADATAALFDGEWLNTGDLAYVAGGDVHITGRTKDVIIRAGRNIHPAEFEDAIGGLDGLRKGSVAVFGSADPDTGTERLIVLAETRMREGADIDALTARINELAVDLIGAPPDDVVLAPPRTVLKTSSGKVRRRACRDIYERGLIGKPPAAVWWQIVRLWAASLGPRVGRRARGAGTLAVGAYGWALVCVVAPVLWVGALVVPTLKVRWAVLGAGIRLLARLMGMPLTVQGLDRLPPMGPGAVYVSNHASYLDGFVLAAALPRPVRFVAKAELRQSFLTRLPLAALDAEFVERFDHAQGLDDAERIVAGLRQGAAPLFFAEGTFSRMPGLLPFHMGAFTAAVEAARPVIPVVIRGTRAALRDKTWLPRPGPISVTVCDAMAPEPPSPGATPWARAVALRDRVRGTILGLTGEPDLAREDPVADSGLI